MEFLSVNAYINTEYWIWIELRNLLSLQKTWIGLVGLSQAPMLLFLYSYERLFALDRVDCPCSRCDAPNSYKCVYLLNPTSSIYLIELGFINNCNEPQL